MNYISVILHKNLPILLLNLFAFDALFLSWFNYLILYHLLWQIIEYVKNKIIFTLFNLFNFTIIFIYFKLILKIEFLKKAKNKILSLWFIKILETHSWKNMRQNNFFKNIQNYHKSFRISLVLSYYKISKKPWTLKPTINL